MIDPNPIVQRLFDELCELPESERSARLARCEDDTRDHVRKLLELYDRPDSSFDHAMPVEIRADLAPPELPEQIGPYRVRSVLGEGAMGIVYLADQQTPQRQVAIKVLQGRWLNAERTRRFQREAELLGRMQHPGIAQIFESGVTSDGSREQTYIAMEYVEGVPLVDYVSERSPDLRERARLMIALADAVHHAHLRGVLHRDLKPSNVLVTADGQVKVIDFGVARPLEEDSSLHTRTGQIVGTLSYMSPEQVRGDPGNVDARADVYALGVMAYELFSGELPYDLRFLSLTEVARIVCEVDPPLLGKHRTELRGDLEQIVAKAFEKEPARRYPSSAALAEDLQRYLNDEPIVARPASAIYQLRKAARRHRVAVSAAVAALLALLVGLGVAVGFAVRNAELAELERQARGDADFEAQRANEQAELADARAAEAQRLKELAILRADQLEAVGRYQSEILYKLDPREMGRGIREDLAAGLESALARSGEDVDTVALEQRAFEDALGRLNTTEVAVRTLERTIFDRSFEALDEQFEPGSEPQLMLLMRLGRALTRYGLHERAVEAYSRTRDGYARIGREEEALASREGVMTALYGMGRFEEAGVEAVEGQRQAAELLGEDSEEALRWFLNHAVLVADVEGDPERASVLYRRVLEVAPEGGDEFVHAMTGLAATHAGAGRFEEAEALQAEAFQAHVDLYGDDDPQTLEVLYLWGEAVMRQGRFGEARELVEGAVQGLREAVGELHPKTLHALTSLAETYLLEDRLTEAEPLVREALAGWRQVYGDVHPQTAMALTNLVNIYMRRSVDEVTLGDAQELLPLAEESADIARELWGVESERTLMRLAMLRDVLRYLNHLAPEGGYDARLAEVEAQLTDRF